MHHVEIEEESGHEESDEQSETYSLHRDIALSALFLCHVSAAFLCILGRSHLRDKAETAHDDRARVPYADDTCHSDATDTDALSILEKFLRAGIGCQCAAGNLEIRPYQGDGRHHNPPYQH